MSSVPLHSLNYEDATTFPEYYSTPEYIYPIIILSDSDVEDTFSSTHSPDYISALSDYSLASPGYTSPNFSDDLTKDLLSSLSILLFHDDPYMKIVQAYDTIPPLQVIITLPAVLPPSLVLSLSPMFDSRDSFPSKKISPPKDTETPISPSLLVESSSPIRSTTPPPDYLFNESIFAKWRSCFLSIDILNFHVRVDNIVAPYGRPSLDILLPSIRFPYSVKGNNIVLHDNTVPYDNTVLHDNNALHNNIVPYDNTVLHDNIVPHDNTVLHDNNVLHDNTVLHDNNHVYLSRENALDVMKRARATYHDKNKGTLFVQEDGWEILRSHAKWDAPDPVDLTEGDVPGHMLTEFCHKREAAKKAYEVSKEKDRMLMRLEDIATSTKDLSEDDAFYINC
ncbi:reverse transcriptase domain-containing protein [Tanacetum coccineum]